MLQGTRLGSVTFVAMVNGVAQNVPNRWKFVDDIRLAVSSDVGGTIDASSVQRVMDGVSEAADHEKVRVEVYSLVS